MQKLKLIIPDMRKFFMSGIKTENTSCGMDMTSGSLWKKIDLFSIPLMMSQVLEVLFNMSDVAVVGKFASYEALGAVGSTTILVTLFTGFLIGMGCGVNVIVARQLGARQHKDLKDTIQTAFILCLKHYMYFMCTFIAESIKYKRRTYRRCDALFQNICTWYACHGSIQLR